MTGLGTSLAQAQQPWTLSGVKIYPAPDAPPIRGEVVQSVIAGEPRTTAGTKRPSSDGGVIVAGFQNSHVHFTG